MKLDVARERGDSHKLLHTRHQRLLCDEEAVDCAIPKICGRATPFKFLLLLSSGLGLCRVLPMVSLLAHPTAHLEEPALSMAWKSAQPVSAQHSMIWPSLQLWNSGQPLRSSAAHSFAEANGDVARDEMSIRRRDAVGTAAQLIVGLMDLGMARRAAADAPSTDVSSTMQKLSDGRSDPRSTSDLKLALPSVTAELETDINKVKQLRIGASAQWEKISASVRSSLEKGTPKDVLNAKSILDLKMLTIKNDMRAVTKFAVGGDILVRDGNIAKFDYNGGTFTYKPMVQVQEDIFARVYEVSLACSKKDAASALKSLDEADTIYAEWSQLMKESGL
eukprot:gnl/TRDRNA2_/TRDRNA2_53870_c0_seq1.p1 gnl/TRDRNA2_/TRDRNA2_53870_c0~~gnl/TRDRNA2_/TRDRNA2_53870_c0_seq1.p1  ORF type:complete len:334 (-),score=65.20 gnl/TRDRNA2_/TRDRNA2_53870_c0_seq1:153-1154(-)